MLLGFSKWSNNSVSESERSAKSKILLLHGMGGTGALWRPIAVSLEDQYEILAPDQRGHGKSQLKNEPKSTYFPQDFGKDIAETVEAESFFPCTVVGHSMGVRSACAFAHLKPEYVKALVLIDLGLHSVPGGSIGGKLFTFLKDLPDHFPTRSAAKDYLMAHCPDKAMAQYLLAVSTVDPITQNICFPFDHEALQKIITSGQNFDARPWLEQILKKGIRVLFLRGETSTVWSKEAYEAEKAKFSGYPNAYFEEFQGAGHGLPFEKKNQFIERLKTFEGP